MAKAIGSRAASGRMPIEPPKTALGHGSIGGSRPRTIVRGTSLSSPGGTLRLHPATLRDRHDNHVPSNSPARAR